MRELPGALAGPRVVTLGGTEDPLAIDRNEMLRYLGHTGQNIEDDLACRIERVARDVEAHGRARGVFATFPVDVYKRQTLSQLTALFSDAPSL